MLLVVVGISQAIWHTPPWLHLPKRKYVNHKNPITALKSLYERYKIELYRCRLSQCWALLHPCIVAVGVWGCVLVQLVSCVYFGKSSGISGARQCVGVYLATIVCPETRLDIYGFHIVFLWKTFFWHQGIFLFFCFGHVKAISQIGLTIFLFCHVLHLSRITLCYIW